MIELTYRFDPNDIHLYRKLASDRATRQGSGPAESWGRYLVATFVAAAVLAACDVGFPALTGRAFAYPEFISGFLAGYAALLALMWWRYRRLARGAARPGGPTLSEHRMSISEEVLKTRTEFAEGVYRWSAFEDVTINDTIVVLWLEPGAGVIVPRAAFGDTAAETAFLQAVEKFMASSGGRRGAASALGAA